MEMGLENSGHSQNPEDPSEEHSTVKEILDRYYTEGLQNVKVVRSLTNVKRQCWQVGNIKFDERKFIPDHLEKFYQKPFLECGTEWKDLKKGQMIVVQSKDLPEVTSNYPCLFVISREIFAHVISKIKNPASAEVFREKAEAGVQPASGKAHEEGPQEPSRSGKRPGSPRFGRKEDPLETGIDRMMNTIWTNYFKQSRLNMQQQTSDDDWRIYAKMMAQYNYYRDHGYKQYVEFFSGAKAHEMEEVRRYVSERCSDSDLNDRWD
jgi:hypothetical protein